MKKIKSFEVKMKNWPWESWDDIMPFTNLTMTFKQAFIKAKALANQLDCEIRINEFGSKQGHYLNPSSR